MQEQKFFLVKKTHFFEIEVISTEIIEMGRMGFLVEIYNKQFWVGKADNPLCFLDVKGDEVQTALT